MQVSANPLVFLDTETTGLDPARHEVWEIAWAIEDGPIETAYLAHDLRTADADALRLNGYTDRFPGGFPDSGRMVEVLLRSMLTGATIVGANPAFDTAFLRARWGVAPWHHRLLDVEAMAVGVLGLDRPWGLHKLAESLSGEGHNIPAPDHTAAGDVLTTRAVYRALRAAADQAEAQQVTT